VNDSSGFGGAEDDRLQPRDESAVPAAGASKTAVEAPVVPDRYDEVLFEFEQLQNPRSGWRKVILILFVSAILFFVLGLLRSLVTDLLLLMVVILVHEMGHFLGMRVFGYSNVRMFFIPLFGAGVSGRKIGVEGYKEAIVVLLGPLPGLVISFFLALAYGSTDIPLLGRTAAYFAVVNAFNLLPVFPLDGGRLLQITLFSRNRYLESFFQILAALALIGFGLKISWVLSMLGGLMLLGVPFRFKINGLAMELNKQLATLALPATDDIPRPLFRHLVDRVYERFPDVTSAKQVAQFVLQVWERMHYKPPGILASLALLMVYAGTLLGTVFVTVVLGIVFGWWEAGPQ
jgi:Zn-dependent protease